MRDPAQTSKVDSIPPGLKKTGVLNFQSGVHTPKVPAVMPPPAEAIAPITILRNMDCDILGSACLFTSSRDDVTEPMRRIASGRNNNVSNTRGLRALNDRV